MKLGHDINKPVIANRVKSPFGVPTKPAERPMRQKPQEVSQNNSEDPTKNTFAGTLVNTITPFMNKIPVKVLSDYKPFAEAGLEITKNAVESSGICKYFTFDPFKNYFNITNLYVLKKLLLIIAPFSEPVFFLL